MSVRVQAFPEDDSKARARGREMVEMINSDREAEEFRYARAYWAQSSTPSHGGNEMAIVFVAKKIGVEAMQTIAGSVPKPSGIVVLIFYPGTDGVREGFQYAEKSTRREVYAYACDPHSVAGLVFADILAGTAWPLNVNRGKEARMAMQNTGFFLHRGDDLDVRRKAAEKVEESDGDSMEVDIVPPPPPQVYPFQTRIARRSLAGLQRLSEHPSWKNIPGLDRLDQMDRVVVCILAIVETKADGLHALRYHASAWDPEVHIYDNLGDITTILREIERRGELKMVLVFYRRAASEKKATEMLDEAMGEQANWIRMLATKVPDAMVQQDCILWYYNYRTEDEYRALCIQQEWHRLRGSGTMPYALASLLGALSLRKMVKEAYGVPMPFSPIMIVGYAEEFDAKSMDYKEEEEQFLPECTWVIYSDMDNNLRLSEDVPTFRKEHADPSFVARADLPLLSWTDWTRLMSSTRQVGLVGLTMDQPMVKLAAFPDFAVSPSIQLDEWRRKTPNARRVGTDTLTDDESGGEDSSEASEGSDGEGGTPSSGSAAEKANKKLAWSLDTSFLDTIPPRTLAKYFQRFMGLGQRDLAFYAKRFRVSSFTGDARNKTPALDNWRNGKFFLASIRNTSPRLVAVVDRLKEKTFANEVDQWDRGTVFLSVDVDMILQERTNDWYLEYLIPSAEDRDIGFTGTEMLTLLKFWASSNRAPIKLADASQYRWYDEDGHVRSASTAVSTWLKTGDQYSFYETVRFKPTSRNGKNPSFLFYRDQLRAPRLKYYRRYFYIGGADELTDFATRLRDAKKTLKAQNPDASLLDLANYLVRHVGTLQMPKGDYGNFMHAVKLMMDLKPGDYACPYEVYVEEIDKLVRSRKGARREDSDEEEQEAVASGSGTKRTKVNR